jgi:hypothetical protein
VLSSVNLRRTTAGTCSNLGFLPNASAGKLPPMKSLASLLALCCVVPTVVRAAPWQTLDPAHYHLRSGTNAEWDEFAASVPHGKRLDIAFTARSNTTEHALFLWQDEVKQDWRVELNGRRVGSLFLMESPLTFALRLPPGTLREGSNIVSILPPRENDDIRVGELQLSSLSLESTLRECMAEVTVLDAQSGEPLPGRITVSDRRGNLAPLFVATNEAAAARPGVVYVANGRANIHLLAGTHTFTATRGFEYGLHTTNVTLAAGERRRISLQLRREVSTPGLISSDTHVHTFTYSKHGDATVEERAITLAAEGIELPIATDHDLAIDLAPPASRVHARQYFTPVIGDEVTTRVGHFNIFPVAAGTPLPSNAATNWTTLLDSFRATPGVQVVVFNHPRNVHAGFQPFARTNFNRVTGEARWPFDFRVDAMELLNSSAMQSDYMSVFEDWFALLNAGHRITAVGSSDGHDVSRYIVGQGRTYIECNDGDVASLDVDAACRNLKAGRAYVSMGLLPLMTINDAFRAGDLVTNAPSQLKIKVQVLAPPWIDADRVELFANGTKIRSAPVNRGNEPPGVAGAVQWDYPCPKHDVYFIAIATGPGHTAPHWPMAKPYQPISPHWVSRVIGATNPIRVDADGDGNFQSARDYAMRLMNDSRSSLPQLVEALAAHDESVAIQAAALARQRGANFTSQDFQRAVATGAPSVKRAFAKVLEEAAAPRP